MRSGRGEITVKITIPKFKALELDTGDSITGYYYAENGYWMGNGVPDYSRPVTRHRIVDGDGLHREIAEDTLENA